MDYLYDTNSTWDLNNHIAIPTLDFIKENTGLDMVTGGHAIIGDVKNKVKQLSISAKNKLYNDKSQRVRNALSYYIAYNELYNQYWLNYVSAYIYDTIINGGITDETKQAMQLINVYRFTDRALYEAENSELEW